MPGSLSRTSSSTIAREMMRASPGLAARRCMRANQATRAGSSAIDGAHADIAMLFASPHVAMLSSLSSSRCSLVIAQS
jgi:hypothetical protein